MGLWSGIEKAKLFDRGNFIKGDFNGVLEIKKTLAKQTRKSGVGFIVEFSVVSTNMPDKHAVGSKVSWFQKMLDPDIAHGAVAEWAAACVGIDPADKKLVETEVLPALEGIMDEACDNPTENAFVGLHVGVTTQMTKTQNDRDFTRHTWHPVVQPGAEAVAG